MKYLKLIYLSIGVALLVVILHNINLEEVLQQVTHIGPIAMSIILAIFFVSLLTDVWAWQLTFKSIPLSIRWFYRLFLVRIVGESLNQVTPMASLGGEPIKVMLLKTHYNTSPHESTVSLLLAKTTDTLALVVFLMIGFVLLLGNNQFSDRFKLITGIGMCLFSLGIIIFFLIQRFQLMSLISKWLTRFRWGKKLTKVADIVGDTDEQLTAFYANNRHFALSTSIAFLNWPLGVVQMFFLMYFLGHPVSFEKAWIIESMAQFVRAAGFFIPASLGTQEGVFILVCSVITGNASIGLSVSIIQRFKDIFWIIIGLAIGWLYSFKPTLSEK